MNLLYSISIMFIGSFLTQYFIISYITTYKLQDVNHSLGKIYISLIMAFFIVLLQIIIHDIYNFTISTTYYSVCICFILILVLLYKKQIGINDNNFLRNLIEKHSSELLLLNEIKDKTKNSAIKALTSVIIKNQSEEINDMKKLIIIKKKENNKIEEINIKSVDLQ